MSINLGQVNISTDVAIIGNVKHIKSGLTLISKRLFVKIIRDKNTKERFNNKKTNCHSLTKKILHIAIKNIGIEKKNKCGRISFLSIKNKSKKLKFSWIKSSAHLENL